MGERLFAAVLPPPGVVESLDAFLAPRREAEPRLRWTRPETWHLTMAFMADVSDRHHDRLVDGLVRAASRTHPFGVRLAGGGTFGPPDAARHLWLGVDDPDEGLATLARRARAAAGHAGVRTDGARFVAHLTLARANRPVDVRRLLPVLDTADLDAFLVDHLVLVASHLHDRANRYEVVERFPLAGVQPSETPP